jgi:hypothetical protein
MVKTETIQFNRESKHDYHQRNSSHHHDLGIDSRRNILWLTRSTAAQEAEAR